VADGTVISQTHRRHRASEFKKFLATIDREVPDDLAMPLVRDNYATHEHPIVKRWPAAHPRFHRHFTPTYSSWVDQVGRWFAHITADLLQRSDHRSVQTLEADLRAWIRDWNDNPTPFNWTKTTEQTLTSPGRLRATYCRSLLSHELEARDTGALATGVHRLRDPWPPIRRRCRPRPWLCYELLLAPCRTAHHDPLSHGERSWPTHQPPWSS
jgi:transposase